MTNDEFKSKCGHIFAPRRATTMTAFFMIAKNSKHSGSGSKVASSTADPASNADVEIINVPQSEVNACGTTCCL